MDMELAGCLLVKTLVQRRLPSGNHAASSKVYRTGFMIWEPEIRKCRNLDRLGLIDLAPTFCEFLGIEPPMMLTGQCIPSFSSRSTRTESSEFGKIDQIARKVPGRKRFPLLR